MSNDHQTHEGKVQEFARGYTSRKRKHPLGAGSLAPSWAGAFNHRRARAAWHTAHTQVLVSHAAPQSLTSPSCAQQPSVTSSVLKCLQDQYQVTSSTASDMRLVLVLERRRSPPLGDHQQSCSHSLSHLSFPQIPGRCHLHPLFLLFCCFSLRDVSCITLLPCLENFPVGVCSSDVIEVRPLVYLISQTR